MAFSRLVFAALVLSVSCCCANNVPVFVWGDQSSRIKSKPLEAVSTEDFWDDFKGVLADDPFTVAFIEPTLSPEDISSKNADGSSPLSYLAKQASTGKFSYLSSVDSPVLAIEDNADPNEVDHIKLTDDALSAEIQSNHKFLFIYLKDAKEGESRAELLERHSKFMQDMFEKLKKEHGKVVAVYTGEFPSWVVTSHSRVRRQASNTTEPSEDYVLAGVRLYVGKVELRDGDTVYNLTEEPTSTMVVDDALNTMNTTVRFGAQSLVLNFRKHVGYWYFDSVTVNNGTADEEFLYPTTDLFALNGFSYRCGQRTVFNRYYLNTNSYSNRTVTFTDLQIQPFFSTINETFHFGETFDCVGFFTGPIWAGLFITFILLSITFYGIMMMMDIRTMDRFDDPKGKTITINASE